MSADRQSTIFQAEFGRVTLNLTARPLVEHAHPEFHFIFKLGGGNTGFRVMGREYVLTDEQAIIANPWEPHVKLASLGGATLALTVLVQPQWMLDAAGVSATTGSKFFASSLVTLTPQVQDAVLRIAMSMRAADGHGASPEVVLKELMQLMVREYGDPELARRSLFSGPAMDARVVRATRYMREKALENPALEDIAKHVGLSRSRFFEQFRHCLGVSPQQYLDWQRMALATRMLVEPEASVTDVAYRLGFSAPSHFARFFSQHVGLPPSDFKRGILDQPSLDQG